MELGYQALYRNYIKGKHPQLKSNLNSESEIQEDLLKKIIETQAYFTNLFSSVESTGNPFTTPQIFEIRSEVMHAFSTLVDAVTRFQESESQAKYRG
jgi:hypothetical protein